MKKLWKASMRISVLQLLVGGVTYALTRDVAIAVLAACLAAFAVGLATSTATAFAFAAAFAAAFVGVFVAAFPDTFAVIFAVSTALFVTFAAKEARSDGASEPFWMLWIVAMPLIGALAGGPLLWFGGQEQEAG